MDYFLQIVFGMIGIAVFLWLGYLTSFSKKEIKWLVILRLLIIESILVVFLFQTPYGESFIRGFASFFNNLIGYAQEGVMFVFGGFMYEKPEQLPMFFNVLLPIVFISALIGILQYTKILPLFIKWTGLIMSKISGMGKLESYNAAASIMLGQSEVFIAIKKQLDDLPEKRLYTLCISAMSSISLSIVAAYMGMLEPKYVVVAMVLNLFGGFIIALLINPYTLDDSEDILEYADEEEKQSFFEMLGEYIMDGFNIAVVVTAMLIGFVALIGMINGVFEAVLHISFEEILGYIFAPFAVVMGVPMSEAVTAGGIMAMKLVSNEFVAMIKLTQVEGLSEKTITIISVFLVSFANFSSIGIISGSVTGLSKKAGKTVSKFGLRLVWGATLVSALGATVAGMLYF